MFSKIIMFLCVFLYAQIGVAALVNVATGEIEGGTNEDITGALNVEVNGALYDVIFKDDTCMSIFDNCDNDNDFTFQTQGEAKFASEALRDQVYGGVFENMYFDTTPDWTFGIGLVSRGNIVTPYGLNSSGEAEYVLFGNAEGRDAAEFISSGSIATNWDAGGSNGSVYALWTPVSPVPVPAAIWLFGSGLLGLIGVARRKKV